MIRILIYFSLIQLIYCAPKLSKGQVKNCGISGSNCEPFECCNKNGTCANDVVSCTKDCDRNSGDFCFARQELLYVFKQQQGGVASTEVQSCGLGVGSCPPGYCCNENNQCGTGSNDCDPNLGCQYDFGTCLPLDYQCGPAFGNQECGVIGWCCSNIMFCGKGSFYCSVKNGCISGCTDAVSSTTSTSTSSSSTVITSINSIPTDTSSSTESSSSTSTSESTITTTTTENITITTPTPFTTVLEITSVFTVPLYLTETVNVTRTSPQSQAPSTTVVLITTSYTDYFPITTTYSNQTRATYSLGPYMCDENNPCPNDLCCSNWQYCGLTEEYCSESKGCINNCKLA